MAEYIELGKAKRYFENIDAGRRGPGSTILTPTEFAEYLDEIEIADVAPVVHARWIIGVDDDDFDVKCPACGFSDTFYVAGIEVVKMIADGMHYCPNCGAKMDGGIDND